MKWLTTSFQKTQAKQGQPEKAARRAALDELRFGLGQLAAAQVVLTSVLINQSCYVFSIFSVGFPSGKSEQARGIVEESSTPGDPAEFFTQIFGCTSIGYPAPSFTRRVGS